MRRGNCIKSDFSPGFAGRCPQRLCVFQHNLFNPHTFRPWPYWLIRGEMPLFDIGPTSQNTCFMVHLSEPGLKTGTQALTVRHRAKRRRAGVACWYRVGISHPVLHEKAENPQNIVLNQRIPLPEAE